METQHLNQLGWNTYTVFNPATPDYKDKTIGRIAAQYNELYSVLNGKKELQGMLPGSFYYKENSFPVVGDWVIIQELEGEDKCIITEILPRKNSIARKKSASKAQQQLMAANLDIIFIVQGLDNDFNPRRLERYIVMCTKSDIKPVILFNKCDLHNNFSLYEDQLKPLIGSVPYLFISATTNKGIEQIDHYLQPGITAALLGSSGVGKSTLVNLLLGTDHQKTREVRTDDSKGRHATTTRQMFHLHNGALLVDTPGMRELEPWDAINTIDDIFDDIAKLAQNCYYKDCTHQHEPGCAVQKAIKESRLESKRLVNYQKMIREQEYQRLMADEKGHVELRRKDKEFGKMVKRVMNQKKK